MPRLRSTKGAIVANTASPAVAGSACAGRLSAPAGDRQQGDPPGPRQRRPYVGPLAPTHPRHHQHARIARRRQESQQVTEQKTGTGEIVVRPQSRTRHSAYPEHRQNRTGDMLGSGALPQIAMRDREDDQRRQMMQKNRARDRRERIPPHEGRRRDAETEPVGKGDPPELPIAKARQHPPPRRIQAEKPGDHQRAVERDREKIGPGRPCQGGHEAEEEHRPQDLDSTAHGLLFLPVVSGGSSYHAGETADSGSARLADPRTFPDQLRARRKSPPTASREIGTSHTR